MQQQETFQIRKVWDIFLAEYFILNKSKYVMNTYLMPMFQLPIQKTGWLEKFEPFLNGQVAGDQQRPHLTQM